MRRFASVFVLALLVFVSISPAAAETGSAEVRIYHTLREAGEVNVCINGHPAAHSLNYLWFTQYMTIYGTDVTVDIVSADSDCSDAALFSADLTLESGKSYSVYATGSLVEPLILASADDLSRDGDARVRFAHLSPDTPAVDVWAGQDCSADNSLPLFVNASYTEFTDYLSVPGGTYDLTACPTGTETAAISLRDVTLGDNSVYTIRAIGLLGDASLQTLTTLDAGHGVVNDAPEVGTVRVFHASSDAPAVDVCVDGAPAITNLAFGEITDYIELPAGWYDVAVIPTDGDCAADQVSGGTLGIYNGVDKTVYASNLLADFDLFSTEDNLTTYGPLWTSVRFAHLIPDAPAVDVYASDTCSGDKLFSHTTFQHVTDYTYVPSGEYSATICVAGTNTAVGTIPVTLGGDNAITIAAIGTLADGFSVEVITDKTGTNVSLIPPTDPDPEPTDPTIADVAIGGGFGTLVAALDAAGLVPTFADPMAGPFTVFAPTDDAFAALPDGTLEALLTDPTGDLTSILQYHVVEGIVPAAEVVALDAFTTLLGKDVTVEVVDGDVILNGAVKVTATDIPASNGIVHVIDAVLLPPADPDPEPMRPVRVCLDFTSTAIIINVVASGASCDDPSIVTLSFDFATGELSFEASDDTPATQPLSGRANVRLWNLTSVSTRRSAQAPMVDLVVGNSCSDAAVLSNVSFNGVSDVVDMAAGTYDFTVCDSATGVLVNTMSNMVIEADQSYSLYAMTMEEDGGMAVSVDDLTNATPLAVSLQSFETTTPWSGILAMVTIILIGYTVRIVRD